jgi:hypothetical protein
LYGNCILASGSGKQAARTWGGAALGVQDQELGFCGIQRGGDKIEIPDCHQGWQKYEYNQTTQQHQSLAASPAGDLKLNLADFGGATINRI